MYLSLSYYLLPSIAITLKVRKRKLLSQSSTSASTTELVGDSFFHGLSLNMEKIAQLPLFQSAKSGTNPISSPKMNAYLIENEVLKKFTMDLFQKATSATLLQK